MHKNEYKDYILDSDPVKDMKTEWSYTLKQKYRNPVEYSKFEKKIFDLADDKSEIISVEVNSIEVYPIEEDPIKVDPIPL